MARKNSTNVEAPEVLEQAEVTELPAEESIEEQAEEAAEVVEFPPEQPEPEVVAPAIVPVVEPVVAPKLVVPANAAAIQWPTDPWGLTSEFKAAVTKLASRVAGHADKKELADKVIAIALAHLEAKYTDSRNILERRLG